MVVAARLRCTPPPAAPLLLWHVRRCCQANVRAASPFQCSNRCPCCRRVGEHEGRLQELHSAGLLLLSIAALLGAPALTAAGFNAARDWLVFATKLVAATAPLFQMNAMRLLE